MKIRAILLVTVMMVAALALPASAVFVQNTSNNQLVFFDDFEGVAASTAPDNGAYPGSWTQIGNGVVHSQGSDPGNRPPYDGLQHMRWQGSAGSFGASIGTFSAPLTTAGGAVLHAELAVWVLSDDLSFSFGFDLNDSGGNGQARGFYRTAGAGGGIRNSVADQNYTGISWQSGWNVLEIDYVLGSSDLTYSLNGTSQTLPTPVINEIASISFREGGAGVGSAFLIDSTTIPEPASLALVGLGGLLMLRRRKA